MIPPDVASNLRLITPDQQLSAGTQQTQPVAATQRVTDVLSNLVPGQRILAEIQALLPNGAYRAVVAQRQVTLALPFSAKPGDSLELEVTESDGKLALAFVANRSAAGAQAAQESVATSLSSAGKLIGDLMQGIDEEGKRAPPAPLNGNRALVEAMPKTAAELAPMLKQALTQSGLFYEAHQARWVAGQMPTEALRQEPQGRLPAAATPATAPGQFDGPDNATPAASQVHSPESGTAAALAGGLQPGPKAEAALAQQMASSPHGPHGIPEQITPLVQQQLDGLANQSFAWQGQIWTGQKMWWEVGENPENRQSADGQPAARWQTRLKLDLPRLGGIDATLRLQPGGALGISITTESRTGESRLRDDAETLRQQLEAAGLELTQLLVQHATTEA